MRLLNIVHETAAYLSRAYGIRGFDCGNCLGKRIAWYSNCESCYLCVKSFRYIVALNFKNINTH